MGPNYATIQSTNKSTLLLLNSMISTVVIWVPVDV